MDSLHEKISNKNHIQDDLHFFNLFTTLHGIAGTGETHWNRTYSSLTVTHNNIKKIIKIGTLA